MDSTYLRDMAARRIQRRRLLKAGAAFSVGAASLALVGCGSDKDGGQATETSTTISGLYTPPQGEPRRGGKFAKTHGGTNNHSVLDNGQNGANIYGVTVYDRPITGKLDERRYQLEAAEKLELVEPLKLEAVWKQSLYTRRL